MSNKINIKGGFLDHNLRCAANLDFIEGSCLSLDELKALAYTYNNALKQKNMEGEAIKLVNDKSKMINELDSRFKKCNGKQLCWLKQDFIEKTNEFEATFKSVISQMPSQLQNISDYIINTG